MTKKNYLKLMLTTTLLFFAAIFAAAKINATAPDVNFGNATALTWKEFSGYEDFWDLGTDEIDVWTSITEIADYTNSTDTPEFVAYNGVNAIYDGHVESYIYWVFDGVNEVVDFYNYKFHKKETVAYADLVDVKRYDNPAGDVPSPKYLIRFYVDGNLYQSQNVQVGFTVDLPEVPEKDDFTFVNWYRDPDLHYIFNEEMPVEYSFDLYAKWQKNDVQVKFFNGDELYETKDVVIGNSIDHLPIKPSINSYIDVVYEADFKDSVIYDLENKMLLGDMEWSISRDVYKNDNKIYMPKDCFITSLSSFSSIKEIKLLHSSSESINLELYYSKNGINYIKSSSGHINSSGPIFIRLRTTSYIGYGNPIITLQSIKITTNLNYETGEQQEFVGWYYDKEYQNPYDVNDIITADTDVYSKWKTVEHNIDFKVDNEIYESCIFNPAKDEFVLPEAPVKTGYEFVGWYYDDEFLTLYDPEAAIDSDLILYAKWELLEFNISFYLGSELYNNLTHNAEIDFILPSTPIPENEEDVFLGWYYDENFETQFKITDEIDSDLILYGKFGLAGSGGTDLPDDDSSRLTFKKEYILYTFLGIVAILVIAGLFKPKKRKRR